MLGLTSIRWQIEVEDGDDCDEDAGQNDVEYVVHGFTLDDQIEGDVFIQVLFFYILPGRLVTDMPFTALCGKGKQLRVQVCVHVCILFMHPMLSIMKKCRSFFSTLSQSLPRPV